MAWLQKRIGSIIAIGRSDELPRGSTHTAPLILRQASAFASVRSTRPPHIQTTAPREKQTRGQMCIEREPTRVGGGGYGQGDDLFSLPRNGTAPLAKGYSKGVSRHQQHILKRKTGSAVGSRKNFDERKRGANPY